MLYAFSIFFRKLTKHDAPVLKCKVVINNALPPFLKAPFEFKFTFSFELRVLYFNAKSVTLLGPR
jgi:hypothetical protein